MVEHCSQATVARESPADLVLGQDYGGEGQAGVKLIHCFFLRLHCLANHVSYTKSNGLV